MTNRRIFQLIDFDRTLFDTAAFATALTDEINRQDPGLGTVYIEAMNDAYLREETFFLLRYLREQKGDEWLEALVNSVITAHGADSFCLPGVNERLMFAHSLSDLRPSWGILTYGDAIDQYMKLRIVGLEGAAVYITDTPDKAALIRSWQTADGTYVLPEAFGGAEVDELTLEDDKLRAFHSLPENVTGIWLTQDETEAARSTAQQLGDVTPAQSLFDAIEILKKKFRVK